MYGKLIGMACVLIAVCGRIDDVGTVAWGQEEPPSLVEAERETAGETSEPTAYQKELLRKVATRADLTPEQVQGVFDALREQIRSDLKAHQKFTMPGLFKVKVVHKPAVKERKGVNPFTGEEMHFKGKPARRVVKIMPLKELKGMG